jgi:hypothetical protein
VANASTKGESTGDVIGWTGEGDNDLHAFPTGPQVFHEIPFEILDPESHQGKVCLGLSGQKPYAREAKLEVGSRARSLYILHAANSSYYTGAIYLEYSDGTSAVDHVGSGKIANWWYPTAPQDRKQTPHMRIAWRGQNARSRNVGICLYGLNNPHPEKEISHIRFISAGNNTKWMVLGLTLSSEFVYFIPDRISAGIPDNWGAGAVVYALVEGLCGVKDRGVAFQELELSPRWAASGEKQARVDVVYPASKAYVSYHFVQDDERIRLLFTGSQEQSHIRILLPEKAQPVHVRLNGETVPWRMEEIEESRYLLAETSAGGVNVLEFSI